MGNSLPQRLFNFKMGKDTYYFSHDSNARNDIKIIRLRRALGMEGYGIYFALIEILREQESYQLSLESLTDIAFDLHTSDEKVKSVVLYYDLFTIQDDLFFSARLLRSMDEYNNRKQKYIDAGKKGGEASVKHRLSNAQALKESKVKESKVNTNQEVQLLSVSTAVEKTESEHFENNIPRNKWVETFDNRMNVFKTSLYPFTNGGKKFQGPYSGKMVEDFFKYWSEPNKSKSRMRWESEKTWDLGLRLGTWAKRERFDPSKKDNSNYTPPSQINHDNL